MTDIEILSAEVLNGLIVKGWFGRESDKFDNLLTKEIRAFVEALKEQPELDDTIKETILKALKDFVSLFPEEVQKIEGKNLIEKLDSFVSTNKSDKEQIDIQAALFGYKAFTKNSSQIKIETPLKIETPQKLSPEDLPSSSLETPQTPVSTIEKSTSSSSIKRRKAKNSNTLKPEDQRLAAKAAYELTAAEYALLREKINSAPVVFVGYVSSIYDEIAKRIEEETSGDNKGQVCKDSYQVFEQQLATLNLVMRDFIDFNTTLGKIVEIKQESKQSLVKALEERLDAANKKMNAILAELKPSRFKIKNVYSEVKEELNTLLEQYFYFEENRPELEKQASNLNSSYKKLLEFFGKEQINLLIFDQLYLSKTFKWNIQSVKYLFEKEKQEVEKLDQDMQKQRAIFIAEIDSAKQSAEKIFESLKLIKKELGAIQESIKPLKEFSLNTRISNFVEEINLILFEQNKNPSDFETLAAFKKHLEFLQRLQGSSFEERALALSKEAKTKLLELNALLTERSSLIEEVSALNSSASEIVSSHSEVNFADSIENIKSECEQIINQDISSFSLADLRANVDSIKGQLKTLQEELRKVQEIKNKEESLEKRIFSLEQNGLNFTFADLWLAVEIENHDLTDEQKNILYLVFLGLGNQSSFISNENHAENIDKISSSLIGDVKSPMIETAAVYIAYLENKHKQSELTETYAAELHENYKLQTFAVEQIIVKVDGYINEKKHEQDKKNAFSDLKPNLDEPKLIANPKQKIINHRNAIKPEENNKMEDVYTEHRNWFRKFLRMLNEKVLRGIIKTKFFTEQPKSQVVAAETLDLADQAVPPTAAVG